MKFLKQATYIRHVIAKLSKFTKSACRPPEIPFCKGHIFVEVSGKNFSFVILHKLAKFRYQTVFTSQVIQ